MIIASDRNDLIFLRTLLLVHFTGRLLIIFLLHRSSSGGGITWSIGVDRRHSSTISMTRLLDAAFLIADLMDCTQHSAKPLFGKFFKAIVEP